MVSRTASQRSHIFTYFLILYYSDDELLDNNGWAIKCYKQVSLVLRAHNMSRVEVYERDQKSNDLVTDCMCVWVALKHRITEIF